MSAQLDSTSRSNLDNKASNLSLSFEFFPPKNIRMERTLWRNIGQLEMIDPSFFSVTYGALGSESERSLDTVFNMDKQCSVPVASHLTSAGHTRDELLALADKFHTNGIDRIVALRGDADQIEGGVKDVPEMIEVLRSVADFDISVAAYPEVHPKAPSLEADLIELKRKLDAGSNRALTQYFFDAEVFLRFRDAAEKMGITQPLVPGILPITNFERMVSFSQRCGANVPEHLYKTFEGTEPGSTEQQKIGIELAVNLSNELIAEGVEDIHFYTLNVPSITFEITQHIGVPVISKAPVRFAAAA